MNIPKSKSLDIEELTLFTQVFQQGNFSKVCRQYSISKPTLSRKIQNLEESLGVQLFVRTTRSLRPTEIAREFYVRALAVVLASQEAMAMVHQRKQEPQGLLRIAAGVEYGTLVVSPAVNAFCLKYPKVDVELDLSGRTVDLIQEGFDIAIRIGVLADSTLAGRRVGSLRYGLFASPRYLAKAPVLNHPDDLVRHQTLLFTRSRHKEVWHFTQDSEAHVAVHTQPKLRSNHFRVLQSAAESGLGIAFMPHFMAQDGVASGALVSVLEQWHSEEKPIHVLYPAQKFIAPKIRNFVDFFCTFLKRNNRPRA